MEQAQFRLHENSLGLLTRPPNALDHLLPPLLPGLQHHPSLHHHPSHHLPGNHPMNALPGFLTAHHTHHSGYSSYLTPPTSSPLATGSHPPNLQTSPILSSAITSESFSSASIAAAAAAAGIAASGIASSLPGVVGQPPPPPIGPPSHQSSHSSYPSSSPSLNESNRLTPPLFPDEDFRSTSIVALRLKAREHLEVLGKASTMV